MENCKSDYKKCTLEAISKILNLKGPSRDYSNAPKCSELKKRTYRPKKDCEDKHVAQPYFQKLEKNACSGVEKLNKKAFLSMLGSKKFEKTNFMVSFDEIQQQEVNNALALFEGNKKKAAAYLQISKSSLDNKLKKYDMQSDLVPNSDETTSPNQSRKFFENIENPWKINSFSSRTKQVCVEINNPSTITLISQIIPSI